MALLREASDQFAAATVSEAGEAAVGYYRNDSSLATFRDENGNTAIHILVEKILKGENSDSSGKDGDSSAERVFPSTSFRHVMKAASFLVNEENRWGRTPLHVASFGGCLVAVTQLLSSNTVDVDKRSRDGGCTALYFSCCRGHVSVAQRLLQAGADPNAKTESASTPLMAASAFGSLNTVTLLLDHGARPNDINLTSGSTALHAAASSGHVAILECLVSRGGNPALTDKSGLTPDQLLQKITHFPLAAIAASRSRPQKPSKQDSSRDGNHQQQQQQQQQQRNQNRYSTDSRPPANTNNSEQPPPPPSFQANNTQQSRAQQPTRHKERTGSSKGSSLGTSQGDNVTTTTSSTATTTPTEAKEVPLPNTIGVCCY